MIVKKVYINITKINDMIYMIWHKQMIPDLLKMQVSCHHSRGDERASDCILGVGELIGCPDNSPDDSRFYLSLKWSPFFLKKNELPQN